MQIKYFQTSWNDIKNSPGWFGKLCLLALLNFIPIFGQIVTYGYLYGWAREIAWGTHQPMPAKIFSNEDGKFYRRGWFLLVIAVVFGLIPGIIMFVGSSMQSASFVASSYSAYSSAYAVAPTAMTSAIIGSIVYFAGYLLMLFISIFTWIAFIRTSIYDRLSAGFQLGKVWKMFRHDTRGIFKIFGMNLLVGFILGFIFAIAIGIITFFFVAIGVGGMAGMRASASSAYMPMLLSMGGIATIVLLVVVYFLIVAALFLMTLVARAVGYWTMQFDVPQWRGQDDPMPFEAMEAQATAQQPGQQWQAPQQPQPQPQQPQVAAQPQAQAQAPTQQPHVGIEPQAPVQQLQATEQPQPQVQEDQAQPMVDRLSSEPPAASEQTQPEDAGTRE